MTDAELLEAYSSRQDDVAFGELMRRHGAMVYRACHRLLKDPHEAEDASQAVFVVLARKAGGLRKGDLAAWLYRVAHLVAAETVRKRMHRTGREEIYAVNAAIQLGEFSQDEIADPAVLGLVDAALLSLPERYRQAVILRYLQNHSEKDAARLVGCPLGTLSRRASEGIAMLRKRLTKRGVALSGVALAGLLTSEASAAVPETLLPSILAVVKTAAATTATATTATSTAAMLAKGAMKAMFIAKVKMAAAVVAAVVVTGAAVPVGIAVAQAAGVRNEGAAPRAITATAENEKVMPRAGVARMADKTRMKMEAIVIPELDFQQASIHDVVEFLQEASVMFDKSAGDQGAKGVNLIVRLGQEDAPLITLSARYISLLDALKMVTDLANLTYAITDEGVEVSRKKDRTGKKQDGTDEPSKRSVDLGKMSQRTYTISPLAATALAEKTGGGTDNEKIKQMFVNLGIAFPPGSAVTYLPSSRELIARNSAENLEAVENSLAKLLTLADDEDLKEKMSRRRQ